MGKNTDNLADKPSSIILTKNASIISVPLLTNLYVLPTDTFRGKKKGLLSVAQHSDPVHIVHRCDQSSHRCKCGLGGRDASPGFSGQ